MPVIVNQANFNPSALQASDVYIRIIPPPGFLQGQPTDVIAVVGTASWGPLNSPQLLGSPGDLAYYFGGLNISASSDPYDMPTDILIAFQQAQSPASIQAYGIRVDDGTSAPATVTLLDTTGGTPKSALVLNAKWNGIAGNNISVQISAGNKTNTFNATVIPFNGGLPEYYPNIPHVAPGATSFWTNFKNALLNGLTGLRGPSQLLTPSTIENTAIAPATGTFALTGGTDGRSGVTSANLIGSDTAQPKTGIYALRGLVPQANIMWLAGCTDTTVFATIQAFVESEGMLAVLPFPKGTSSATAISSKKTIGIDSPFVVYVKDWIRWYDPVAGATRFVPPTAFIGGRIATLSPEISPCNKSVAGVVGTERQDTGSNLPYSLAECGQLQQAGIMFITNPVPGGNYWGMRHGQNSSSNPVQAVVEWTRMTNYLAHSLAAYMGKYVGQNQSQRANDPLRAAVKLDLDQFLALLKSLRQIDDFVTVCDLTNNSTQSIAQHFLFADVRVRYMSSVQFFVISLQGGTTVVTINNAPGDTLIAT